MNVADLPKFPVARNEFAQIPSRQHAPCQHEPRPKHAERWFEDRTPIIRDNTGFIFVAEVV